MSNNTSATGGYLSPKTTPAPTEGDALDDALQEVVVGITGIAASLVRPRWQPTPPPQPDANTDWCAIGITDSEPDANAYIAHDGTGDGQDNMQRHEDFQVLASFYGPNGRSLAGVLRDGLQVGQNRYPLDAVSVKFIGTGRILSVPELINEQWVRRVDMTIDFRRQVDRAYPVLNIDGAQGTFSSDNPTLTTPWNVEP